MASSTTSTAPPSLCPYPIIQKKENTLASDLFKAGLSITLVYSTHYGAAKLYNAVCVPDGLYGYASGFITTASPWCRLLLEVMKLTENQYSSIILIVLSGVIMKALGV
jgi:hypothetical protein